MKSDIELRAIALAEYIIENQATVRAASKKFGVSKSTVHTDVTNGVALLQCINSALNIFALQTPLRFSNNISS